MADVKDILGVPRNGAAAEKTEAPKAKEPKAQRPAGMSREAFALLDGSHPVVPSLLVGDLRKKGDLQGLKEKRKTSGRGQVTWQWRRFTNPARQDGLELQHWVKCYRDPMGKVKPADEGEYHYAKYNKQPMVYCFDDEEWENVVPKDAAWSREETDYLLDLCKRYALRFLVIADRYEWPGNARTCEDMKERYYAVARALMIARQGSEDSIANHPLVRHPFNAQHERERKRGVALLLARTPAQDAADLAALEAARGIDAQRRAEAAARRAPAPTPTGSATAEAVPSAAGAAEAPLLGPPVPAAAGGRPGVVARGAHTVKLAAEQLTRVPGGARAQKLVDTTMAELGVGAPPRVPTRQACGAWLALRGEVIHMLELKKRLQNRAIAEGLVGAAGPEGRAKRAKGKSHARLE